MSFIKHIKIGDIILIILIIFFSYFYYNSISKNKSDKIIIDTPNGSFRYDLSMNREIEVDGILNSSRIIIDNHTIKFDTAPCRDKLCIRAGILRSAPLICMPNGIVIRYDSIKSDNGLEIDSVVQ